MRAKRVNSDIRFSAHFPQSFLTAGGQPADKKSLPIKYRSEKDKIKRNFLPYQIKSF